MSKHHTPFQPQHALDFGVEIRSCDVHDAVSLVQCLFCMDNGQGDRDEPNVKHRCIVNVQLWKQLFCKENYCSHNECQHFVEWESYNLLTNKANKSYLVNKKK